MDTGIYQKSELILVLLGEKPATDLEHFSDDPEEVADMLESYGLSVVQKGVKNSENSRSIFSVSNKESLAKKLANTDPEEDHEMYGKLMGYPDSAISAFEDENGNKAGNELRLEREEYPEELDKLVFNSFILSKKNWEQEVKILQRWQNVLEKAAPDMVEKFQS